MHLRARLRARPHPPPLTHTHSLSLTHTHTHTHTYSLSLSLTHTDRTGLDGRIGQSWLTILSKWTGFYEDPLQRALRGTPFQAASRPDLGNTFK